VKKVILIFFLFFSQNTLFCDVNTGEEKSFLDSFAPLRADIINGYHNFLKKIDNALCANEDLNNTNLEKIIYKNNLQIITALKHNGDEKFMPYLYIRGNIILPKTNKRFEFTVDKQTDSKRLNQNIDAQYDSAIKDEKVHLGFKYNLVKDDYFNFYTKLGARINNPGDVYGKVGAIKYLNFKSFMLFFDAQIYKYLLNEKLIASTSLNFIKPLNENFIFEKDFILTWKKEEKTTELDYIAKLYHMIDKKSSCEYRLSYTAKESAQCYYCPNEYAAHVRYRYMLKKWAYVELLPQVIKRKENQFETEEAITLNFGLIFSK